MRYNKIRRNTGQLLSLTSFSHSKFEAFLPFFKYQGDEYSSHYTIKGKPRQRISYGKKNSQLPFIESQIRRKNLDKWESLFWKF
jgi:hypothetical protein